MKTRLFLFLFLSITAIGYTQTTIIPDAAFGNYLETRDAYGYLVPLGNPTSMGNGIANDNLVTTSRINSVLKLVVVNLTITDLTGIEDFTALTKLQCYNDQLTSINVSANTALVEFCCSDKIK